MTAPGTARLDAELVRLWRGLLRGLVTSDEYDRRGDELCDQADAGAAITRGAARGIAGAWLRDGDPDWPAHPRKETL